MLFSTAISQTWRSSGGGLGGDGDGCKTDAKTDGGDIALCNDPGGG